MSQQPSPSQAAWVDRSQFADVVFLVTPSALAAAEGDAAAAPTVRIRAHRVILAANSEYLCKLLTNGMRETQVVSSSGSLDDDSKDGLLTIPLPGVDEAAFRCVLDWVYAHTVQGVTDVNVASVLRLADMWLLDGLRDACADRLAGSLTVANCLDLLAAVYGIHLVGVPAQSRVGSAFVYVIADTGDLLTCVLCLQGLH